MCVAGELGQQGSKNKEDVSILQKSIAALDREKDVLQDEVDQKTEKLVALQEENLRKVLTASKPHQDHQARDRITFLSVLNNIHKYVYRLKEVLVLVSIPSFQTSCEKGICRSNSICRAVINQYKPFRTDADYW